MEYTTLGRTGLRVSVAGLGCGGSSRLGLTAGHSEKHGVSIVRQAIDLGVNLIDTANSYGTESI
ncbi:MAG TPA: aldo/keto reductase, partial [Burkholderiales bacterium]|nr:aldo/keto reductase [Burkholderiales bacterium]